METKKEDRRGVQKRIMALLLVLVFLLGMYLSFRVQIKFSGLNYVGNVAEYAAKLTENNTSYLSESTLERAWSILKTTVGRPRTYEEFNTYASIAIAREDYENAAAYLEGCLAHCEGGAKEEAVLCLRLGSLYVLMQNSEEALTWLDLALQKDDTLASAYFLRAEVRLEQGETDKALEDLHSYQGMEGSSPVILASLGELYESAGEYENAVSCYTLGLSQAQSYRDELYVSRARCQIFLGEMSEARRDLERYFVLTNEDPGGEAAAMLGMCLMDAGEFAGAVEQFHRAVEDGYENAWLLYSQSVMCAYVLGDYTTAVRDGKLALAGSDEAGENGAELALWIGLSYFAREQWKEAAEYFDMAAARDGDLADLCFYRGVCAFSQEDMDAAITFFTASIERGESVSECCYNRALCYIAKEDAASAAEDLSRFLTLSDDESMTEQASELLQALTQQLEEAQSDIREAHSENEEIPSSAVQGIRKYPKGNAE